jgi:hypothetical protein
MPAQLKAAPGSACSQSFRNFLVKRSLPPIRARGPSDDSPPFKARAREAEFERCKADPASYLQFEDFSDDEQEAFE